MYLRFIVPAIDPSSQVREGIFQAAYEVCDSDGIAAHERAELDELLGWFGQHLKKPDRLSRSNRQEVAISWFKPTAMEHIRRIRRLAEILMENGIVVEVIKTARPGYIVYEDDVQIATEPFRETPTG